MWTGRVQMGLEERCDIAREARSGRHEGRGLCGDRLWKERVCSVSGKTRSERSDVLSWEAWFHLGWSIWVLSRPEWMSPASIFQDCCNKLGLVSNKTHLFSHGAGGWLPLRSLSLACRWLPSCCLCTWSSLGVCAALAFLCPKRLFLEGHPPDWSRAHPSGSWWCDRLFKSPVSKQSPLLQHCELGLRLVNFEGDTVPSLTWPHFSLPETPSQRTTLSSG